MPQKDQSAAWNSVPAEEADGCLKNVDHSHNNSTERFEFESLNLCEGSEDDLLPQKAQDILRNATARCEEEFARLSFRSSEFDFVSKRVDSFEDVLKRDTSTLSSRSSGSEELVLGLAHPEVIDDLKSMVNLMFDRNSGRECIEAYIDARKDALDDCLSILEAEKLSL